MCVCARKLHLRCGIDPLLDFVLVVITVKNCLNCVVGNLLLSISRSEGIFTMLENFVEIVSSQAFWKLFSGCLIVLKV